MFNLLKQKENYANCIVMGMLYLAIFIFLMIVGIMSYVFLESCYKVCFM